MAYDPQIVLGIVKARLNRLASDITLDAYLTQRIEAANVKLRRTGITLIENDPEDQLFLADYVAWEYGNRDKPGSMPEWLRLARRERFLRNGVTPDDS